MVSYLRSYYVVNDHIYYSEILEAAVLLRKQFELIARLYELLERDFEKLRGKTPNIGSLKSNLRNLYGDYSGIAHSSDPELFHLLGVEYLDRNLYKIFLSTQIMC